MTGLVSFHNASLMPDMGDSCYCGQVKFKTLMLDPPVCMALAIAMRSCFH